ncbi:MAG TPA: erythromycin esterase family protein [Dehalococcoidia bacterium]|nr:erythromycin esterase family protein [Dehalococcoidia bacterium]
MTSVRSEPRRPPAAADSTLFEQVAQISRPLTADMDALIEQIGDARFVLIGEASHGTHEYYRWRERLSRRLIAEKGFSFVAVEGDWPDCYAITRYVKARPEADRSARAVLNRFRRWPTWMWANREVLEFVEWLRRWNDARDEGAKAGFYGLDVYSLWESLDEVLGYLRRVDPDAIGPALRAFRCFEPYGEDVQGYARATLFVPATCEQEVVAMLAELRANAAEYAQDGREGYFCAEQNAIAARNAERYYRAMIHGGTDSWNVRDRHMVETLERLMQFHGPLAKAIVWEHNTHIGDAAFTDMAREGMVNVGQLVRQQRGVDDVVLIGFGGHRGSVIAGDEWGAPMQAMAVPPARPESWEDVLHRAGSGNRLLLFGEGAETDELLAQRGQRAIGVVYHPEFERWGNYVPTVLPRRYDAFLYFEETRALHPLALHPRNAGEPPETYPWRV